MPMTWKLYVRAQCSIISLLPLEINPSTLYVAKLTLVLYFIYLALERVVNYRRSRNLAGGGLGGNLL